ncbi:MAG TPA: hypothetical protein VHC22_01890 [Pirellulales bacterium]|nr:hypothetical protein [Pirellulales bacterium]
MFKRFSFMVVAASGIAFGSWVVPIERQRRAVTAIEASGGAVFYMGDGDSFLRRWLPQDYFDEVETVFLANFDKDEDAVLGHLKQLSGLQMLSLAGSGFTDAGLVHLHGLTTLQHISFDLTRVTDDGVTSLQQALPKCEISLDGRVRKRTTERAIH